MWVLPWFVRISFCSTEKEPSSTASFLLLRPNLHSETFALYILSSKTALNQIPIRFNTSTGFFSFSFSFYLVQDQFSFLIFSLRFCFSYFFCHWTGSPEHVTSTKRLFASNGPGPKYCLDTRDNAKVQPRATMI